MLSKDLRRLRLCPDLLLKADSVHIRYSTVFKRRLRRWYSRLPDVLFLFSRLAGDGRQWQENRSWQALKQTNKSRNYFIRFRYQGRNINRSLGTRNRRQAIAKKVRIEETIWLLEEGRIEVPTGVIAYRSFIADPVNRRKRGPRQIATVEGYAHQYSRHIESWLGSRKLSAIHATDIDRFHSSVGKHSGPYAANRAVSLISSVYNDAILKGWHWENPAKGIQRFPEPSRTRFLQEDEIGPFIRACEAARTTRLRTVAEIVLLALLSGLRRRNVCRARWEQIDFDRRVWNIPADEMKNGEPHSVYLCDYLHQMLMARYWDRNCSVWVFSSTRTEDPLMEPKKGLATIVERAKIDTISPQLGIWRLTQERGRVQAALPDVARSTQHLTPPGSRRRRLHTDCGYRRRDQRTDDLRSQGDEDPYEGTRHATLAVVRPDRFEQCSPVSSIGNCRTRDEVKAEQVDAVEVAT